MNPFELLKNMNEIKGKAQEMKNKIATIKCTGYACGNMIEAVANGNMEIESLKIDPNFLKPENAEMVAVLTTSAINTALKNVKDRIQEETGQVMNQYGLGGLGL
ncbi:MAG: YbaB/EbfC family nucleoid-associated protein [Sphaerochaetaceae bacterium]|nr:YbaB/EbfC family nucleoid-associated protein [Sphaerochaetaceae bacterium]